MDQEPNQPTTAELIARIEELESKIATKRRWPFIPQSRGVAIGVAVALICGPALASLAGAAPSPPIPWNTGGNSGTNPSANYIGTSDANGLSIRTNKTQAIGIDANQNVTFAKTIHGDITGNAGTVTNGVYTTGNQTIGGTKTFSSTIQGDITGNAGTVTNGLYSNQPYYQPAWLTSVLGSIVSGDITGNAAGFNGNLGGDVTGGQGATVVGKINGSPLGVLSTASSGDVLTYKSGHWVPGTPSSGGVSYVRTIVVSPDPSSATNSGTNLVTALNGITGASATNPYLIHLEPGVYDLGSGSITMKPYVDIEGSGEGVTTIISTIDGGASTVGTVNGADNAELRWLTVKNTAPALGIAIYNDSASPRLTRVTATASAGNISYGVLNGSSSSPTMTNFTAIATASGVGFNAAEGVLNIHSSSPTMINVTATASGTGFNSGVDNNDLSSPTMTNVTATALGGANSSNNGVQNDFSSSPTMTDVTATASGGVEGHGLYNASGSPKIDHSVLKGSTDAVLVIGGTVNVGASRIDGSAAQLAGTLNCADDYSGSYVALNSSCLAF